MDQHINIEDFKNYENVTIAEYTAAKSRAEIDFVEAIKKGKIKEALKAAGLYIELDKLLNKRLAYGQKYGYDGKGKNK